MSYVVLDIDGLIIKDGKENPFTRTLLSILSDPNEYTERKIYEERKKLIQQGIGLDVPRFNDSDSTHFDSIEKFTKYVSQLNKRLEVFDCGSILMKFVYSVDDFLFQRVVDEFKTWERNDCDVIPIMDTIDTLFDLKFSKGFDLAVYSDQPIFYQDFVFDSLDQNGIYTWIPKKDRYSQTKIGISPNDLYKVEGRIIDNFRHLPQKIDDMICFVTANPIEASKIRHTLPEEVNVYLIHEREIIKEVYEKYDYKRITIERKLSDIIENY